MNGGFPNSGIGLLGIALAHAVVLSVMITSTMAISGGHLNPAVTLSLLAAGESTRSARPPTSWRSWRQRWQAHSWSRRCYPASCRECNPGGRAGHCRLGVAGPGIGIELVSDLLFGFAVFGTAVSPDAPRVGGFGIGLVLLFDILVGGPLTGAAMNPARAFGPALVAGMGRPAGVLDRSDCGRILGGVAVGIRICCPPTHARR